MLQVVARFQDGTLVKGTTHNFSPDGAHCHIQPLDRPYGEGRRVEFRELKALFFVRTIEGNPKYQDKESFESEAHYAPRVRVRFKDGEELVGFMNLQHHPHGFFLYPADPLSNNERVFAIRECVDRLESLDEPGLGEDGAAALPPEDAGAAGGGGGADEPVTPDAGSDTRDAADADGSRAASSAP